MSSQSVVDMRQGSGVRVALSTQTVAKLANHEIVTIDDSDLANPTFAPVPYKTYSLEEACSFAWAVCEWIRRSGPGDKVVSQDLLKSIAEGREPPF